uniref:DNA-directed RNA polymerase n=1 Tax=Aegilops tauschii subsp. strangulata TaxID=200361 RepID=A0A453NI50_AEGTS
MPIMLRSYACVLNGKDEAELARYGECPLDPGGYFIVKGTEKVILIQEQLSKNRIIIDTDNKGRVTASVTSSTHEVKSKTVICMDKEKIYLHLNQFTKPIPIIVVMKAMGIETDQEVVQMVGRDPRYGDLLYLSIQECATERIYTQQQALQYMDDKVTYAGAGNIKDGRSKLILRDVFVAHVPVNNGNFQPKCIYTAVMLRRMLDAILNSDTFDDKDYVGNKRLELSGQLVSLLFEDLFKTMNTYAVDRMNKNSDMARSSPLDFSQLIMQQDVITSGLERAISTGNWDIKRFKMHRKGVSQVSTRSTYESQFSVH